VWRHQLKPYASSAAQPGRFRTNAALQWQQAGWPFVPEWVPADRAFNDCNWNSQELGFFQPSWIR
jgi:hypothetical protein